MKCCSKCKKDLAKEDFYAHAKTKDGLRAECKSCTKAIAKDWQVKNSEKEKTRSAKWALDNPDKALAKVVRYRANHPGRASNNAMLWQSKNKESMRAIRNNRRSRIVSSGGRLSSGLVSRLLKLQKGKCPCCGEPLGDDYHLDHIIPLALDGENIDSNMQLLRAKCNLQKHMKHPVDFMRSRGFLL